MTIKGMCYRIKQYLLILLICLFCSGIVTPLSYGARIAGETEVTPTTPQIVPRPPQPVPVRPPARAPVPSRPAQPPSPVQPLAEAVPPQQAPVPVPAEGAVAPQENLPAQPPQGEMPAMPFPQEAPQDRRAPAARAVQPPNAPPRASQDKEGDTRYVTIDFDNVDIGLFIKFISELTGKNFIIDQQVRGKVTIISPTKITVDEAYKVFESVLEVYGFTTVPSGSVIKIIPAVEARGKDIQTRLMEDAISPEDIVVTQLIPLKYADPLEIQKVFAPLISKNSIVVPYSPTGMLIVTDVLSNVKRLLKIVKELDVLGTGEEISVVPLRYASAATMAKSLTDLFQRAGRQVAGRPAPAADVQLKIVADERSNMLIILASENDSRKVKQLILLLDKETPRGEGDIRVYYLQNANAEDLAKVLMSIPSKQTKEAEKGKPPVISKEVQIMADKATNSLVITATKDDYLALEEVISKLDIPRRMVYIEALIMEVSLTKNLDLGVEWMAADEVGSYQGRSIGAFGGSTLPANKHLIPGLNPTTTTTTTGTTATSTLATLPTGFSIGVIGDAIKIGGLTFPSIGAVIRAYQNDSDVHILSTPQILTTDNEEAEITVGKTVPFVTRQERASASSTTLGVTDYSSFDYKDIGVILKITPQINQEGLVRLKVSQELTQVIKEESEAGRPTTLKRSAKTTVIVKDGNTIVMGGLIDETMNKGTVMVPCLGNIPALGWAFKTESSSGGKTNLFVFLTPHVIATPVQADALYEKKKGEIDKAEGGVIKLYERSGDKSFQMEVK